ncbi:MAG: response regulator [Clostridiales Family XIII bacterium]|nr:response regulator [Clostridiales Family XIII bacterium]
MEGKYVAVNEKEALQRRERLLSAVNQVASLLMSKFNINSILSYIPEALRILAESVHVDRAYLWRNREIDGILHSRQIAIWKRNGDLPPLEELPFSKVLKGMPGVRPDGLDIINMMVRDIPQGAIDHAKTIGMKSLLVIPITLDGIFWGFITFEDFSRERHFEKEEEDIMSSGGMIAAAALWRAEMVAGIIEAKDEAQANARAKSEFLSRMSHEIRTPMNAIIGMTAIAKKAKDMKRVNDCLNKIDDSSRQLLSIINDVLDMSKIESGKLEISENEFNFDNLIEHVINVMQVKLDEKKQKLCLDYPRSFDRRLIADELRLSQVLINLLSNANKFTCDNGRIDLRVRGSDGEEGACASLRVEVEDNGIGITEEQMGRLFNSFEQADGGITRKYGGSGLGLALSKKIVELMGGSIWVESEYGKGSRFIFEVRVKWGRAVDASTRASHERYPQLSPEGPQNAANRKGVVKTREKPEGEGDAAPDWGDKKLLLVEDIEINREIIIGLLAETGVAVECSENGLEALRRTEGGEKFDLILMDMQMPEMDGIGATMAIRRLDGDYAKTVPIIAMTANAFKDDVENCLKAGMDGHIAKPVEVSVLMGVLTGYLGYGRA